MLALQFASNGKKAVARKILGILVFLLEKLTSIMQ